MNKLSNLPKIDELLADPRVTGGGSGIAPKRVTEIARACVDDIRAAIKRGDNSGDRGELSELIISGILSAISDYKAERLTPVINATGVIVHTNLGRAVLSRKCAARALEISTGYNNLEFSLKTGARRNRLEYIERLLCDLTGAEAALVVNNNAAAVLLSAAALCAGKEILLSRGEIVEIGDAFRIADIIALSGCKIKEVGTTNRTHISDYEQALSPETGAVAKIHTSNYKITGYTSEVSAVELQRLAEENGIFALEDMGSGVMADLRSYGLPYERTVADAIADGIGVVTISGDKMLGGPQAGIILGQKKYIALMKKHQLLRCLRIDKLSLAALEAALEEYTRKKPDIPVLEYIGQSREVLKTRAERLAAELSAVDGFTFSVMPHTAQVGGGALPEQSLPSWGVLAKSSKIGDNRLEELLRGATPPIVATVQPDGVMLDVIAISDCCTDGVVSAFRGIV
ncbi:MAG: L-seryl-tRNA(Sec) selenium transferase [Defluviitaleaceae bacterium]|nr:L-seryl-tRNA(Sec) selenium transferase [Defluviitaleaceae bacterium]